MYSSLMARTFLIDPQPVSLNDPLKYTADIQQQEKYYSHLLETRTEAFRLLKPGAVAKDVFDKVSSFVAGKSGTLGSAFGKNIGFSVSYPGLLGCYFNELS
jgi:nucleosome binding factor SPN SPT16 subunit